MKNHYLIMILLLLFPLSEQIYSQDIAFNGQAINWVTVNPGSPFQTMGGLRYIPKLTFSQPLGEKLSVDGEFSANLWGSLLYTANDTLSGDYDLSPYRAWIKLSGEQFELRAGLQKINFGSSLMLRPLMWFDRLDPRDPLQLTDGVYGLLGRYYFSNNANIWLWGLYGNHETKGWEIYQTAKKNIEFGGRVQVPLFTGELALTCHHRMADPSNVLPDSVFGGNPLPEDRIAIDGKFDFIAGLWFETTISRIDLPYSDNDYTTMLNLGADYTFNLGSGLNLTSEFFSYMTGKSPYNGDAVKLNFGGISLSYPISIIHNISAIIFYDFTNKAFYRFLNWGITYDKWSFYVMGFWNPENYMLYNFDNNINLFGGWGFQLMTVFNH